ncbi:MAG: Y-family DNA polymerase [Burkholderiales bacterium]
MMTTATTLEKTSLWIGIYLPQLPLETVLRGAPSPEAWAVAEGDRILLADRKAEARGVRAGMLATAALALAPQLRIRARDTAAETESLLGLATWTAQFTPSVALEFPDALLLEVSASLRLFGGVEKIVASLRKGLVELGFTATLSHAPTARAASWFARADICAPPGAKSASAALPRRPSGATADMAASISVASIDPMEKLRSDVATLPVRLLRGRADLPEALANLGIATLGELLALPRDGLARRFGQGLLDQLDQALGELADPRIFFTLPPRFHAGIELPAEITQAEALLFAGKRLLTQLAGFLTARSGGVQRFVFRLAHREGRNTAIAIGLVAASRDADHFVLLLRERLGKLSLSEPVRVLSLDAEDIQALAGANRNLLPDDKVASAASEWPQLIERLRARLGVQAVHAIAVTPEHRPENASCPLAAEVKKPLREKLRENPQMQFAFGERPFWLLDAPRLLAEQNAVPLHEDGPLTLLAGPERIESGWWDGGDVKRDYFIARTPREALLWVYRERQAGWYLHGIFS